MRVLVAGMGNIFLGDDGFGVETAGRLKDAPLPEGVRVADAGLRGAHLAHELLDGYDGLVLIDAVRLGDPPGTLSIIEPETWAGHASPAVDAHDLAPGAVLDLIARLDAEPPWIRIVGCEAARCGRGKGLSEPVAAAVEGAVRLVRELVDDLTACGRTGTPRTRTPRARTARTGTARTGTEPGRNA
ncbi:hydrogenase maturation protease [Spirillospora sp. CA-255316]